MQIGWVFIASITTVPRNMASSYWHR